MILPLDSASPPWPCPPCASLHQGLVCLDAHQPIGQADGTVALVEATLAAVRTADLSRVPASWARWYAARGRGN